MVPQNGSPAANDAGNCGRDDGYDAISRRKCQRKGDMYGRSNDKEKAQRRPQLGFLNNQPGIGAQDSSLFSPLQVEEGNNQVGPERTRTSKQTVAHTREQPTTGDDHERRISSAEVWTGWVELDDRLPR